MASSKKLWVCPQCKRKFANKNQWHSCGEHSIDDLFEGKPFAIKQVFDLLLAGIKKFGPIRIDAVKTSVNFGGKSHFAAVWPLKNSLNVEFLLDREINEFPVYRTQKLGSTTHAHSVKVTSKREVSTRLLGWLKEASELRSE